jgi:hypothetical protein
MEALMVTLVLLWENFFMKNKVLAFAFAAFSFAVPAVAQANVWRCDAWPAFGGASYYWISYDAYYARAQALGACQLNYGNTCYYRCYFF